MVWRADYYGVYVFPFKYLPVVGVKVGFGVKFLFAISCAPFEYFFVDVDDCNNFGSFQPMFRAPMSAIPTFSFAPIGRATPVAIAVPNTPIELTNFRLCINPVYIFPKIILKLRFAVNNFRV